MKVLFLSQIVPYPPHGGVLQRGYHLIRELGRHASVHLLAFVHPDVLGTTALLEESRHAMLECCERVEYFPLWVKQSKLHLAAGLGMSLPSSKPFSMLAHRSPNFGRRTDATLSSWRPDILHADTLALDQFVPRDTATATVLTHHNIESMLMRRRAQVETRWAARTFLERETVKLEHWEQLASPRYDMNVTMSVNDARELERLAPASRIAVVPNGVNTDYFTTAFGEETPALIYTGGMNMFANRDAVLHFLSDMWPLVTAAVPDVRFYAVGQDPPAELREFAAKDPRVVVTGFVDDIRPYVRKAAVYVVPLRVGGGTRLKVLDAMASGKALVSTSVGCEGIGVTPGEHLLIGDTPGQFADATIALLRDQARRTALGTAARELVESTYAWPIVGRQLLDAYDGALRHRAASRAAGMAAGVPGGGAGSVRQGARP